jgi:Na+-transporting methylmalonyl-CoA/oxaloacetate decarboxylase gamma subunit
MTNPWMIMLVGITTVFVALFLIILFLLAFPKFFSTLKKKEHKKLAPLPEMVEVTKKKEQASVLSTSPGENDEELIAVLTAAVAAASGSELGSFSIAHVKQTVEEGYGFNTPVWGRVERLSRK